MLVLFEAACARVYTSGRRIKPIALRKLNAVPIKIKMETIISLNMAALNNNTPFDVSRKCDCTNEGKNP